MWETPELYETWNISTDNIDLTVDHASFSNQMTLPIPPWLPFPWQCKGLYDASVPASDNTRMIYMGSRQHKRI